MQSPQPVSTVIDASQKFAKAESNHIVQFYESEEYLDNVVTQFLGDGLAAGEPLVVIATEPHRQSFSSRLTSNGFDVERLLQNNQLTLLDARETLSRFMVDGKPDWDRFRAVIGGVIDNIRGQDRNKRLRAYGEMVDLLWRDGNPEAAIHLEELWNELGNMYSFSLLCAYVMGNFYNEAHGHNFAEICKAHTHVAPTEDYSRSSDQDVQLREISLLQQRARALESEIEHRRELEKALRKALRGRRRAEEALREASRRKDEFLALLGHELRNPLAPILTALQVMQLRGVGGEREQKIVGRQVRHLARLVDDLLDVSRITRGKIELKLETVELASVLTKAIEIASPLYDQRSHTLSLDVPREGLLIHGDQVRLTQVLANLLTNSAKYTDPAGQILVSAWREDDQVVISVKDNGMGISRELLPKIFELFAQADRTLDRAQGGLGIGLTLARSLLELHGGTIKAHSDGPGKGSEFVVRLPLAGREHCPLKETNVPGIGLNGSLRILVVDDNRDSAEMLAEGLRGSGHEVAVAHDGREALSVALGFQPTTAVLDIGLPGIDGYALAGKLRELMPKRRVRFIAVTGYGQESDKARALEAGFDVHLVKPVDLDALNIVLLDSAGAAPDRNRR